MQFFNPVRISLVYYIHLFFHFDILFSVFLFFVLPVTLDFFIQGNFSP